VKKKGGMGEQKEIYTAGTGKTKTGNHQHELPTKNMSMTLHYIHIRWREPKMVTTMLY
jgi:hypothetical protein